MLEGATAQGQMEVRQSPEHSKPFCGNTARKSRNHGRIHCNGPREGHKFGLLCPGRAVCKSVILTFEAFWLWLVHRFNRFAGSLTLGQRFCDLFLFWCCVACFAGLCFQSWTLWLGRRKVATAKKKEWSNEFWKSVLFERVGLCYRMLFPKTRMSHFICL